jgi:hypothetical protein
MLIHDDFDHPILQHSRDAYGQPGHRIWLTTIEWSGDPLDDRLALRGLTMAAAAYLSAYGIEANVGVGANRICTRIEDDQEAMQAFKAFAETTPPKLRFGFVS